MKRKILSFICVFLPVFAFAACGQGNANSESGVHAAASVPDSWSGDDVIEGTESNQFKVIDNLLISDNLPIIVDFNAKWCGPCRQFSPIFHSVAEKYKGQALFVSIDTDQYPAIANAYKVEAIPTVVFIMPGGGVLGCQTGAMPERQFVDFVNQLITTSAGEEGVI